MPRTVDEIIGLLRDDPPGPADAPNATAPDLAVITPDPDGSKPHSAQARAERRKAMMEAQKPASMTRGAADRTRDITKYAIISRLLAFNATNSEILEALTVAGHDISERTLQRILKRDDFVRYYEAFQGDINVRIAKMLEEFAILAAPEAMNHLVRLMRGAKSSETERQAANDIMKYAGFGRSDGPSALHVHLPPEMAAMINNAGKQIALMPMKALQRAPEGDVRDVKATVKDAE